VVNARDAMPAGGTLAIETDVVTIDEAFARSHPEGVVGGLYARLRVTDTGVGMTPEVLAQIFRPFFTTKGPTAGTGLGLATVHGIVRESNGFITVQSAPRQGATFAVYLPAVDPPPERAAAASIPLPLGSVSGTVLFVEDDDHVRTLGARALRQHGFRVLTARHAAEATALARGYADSIDLLLTDMVMPGMSGRELAAELHESRPGVPVLYTSGYTDGSGVVPGPEDPDINFVPKPYAPMALVRKAQEVMTSPGRPARR
jgi:CheY-like chemotaxis protein